MKTVALLYHDAVVDGHFESSGFAGEDATFYKLDIDEMNAHFDALASSSQYDPSNIYTTLDGKSIDRIPLLLTFDDGGVSAYTHIAELLSRREWVGHFFITTDRIDTPAFLKRDQIRALREMGHVIGSHSSTHPARMSACISTLSEIIQEKVDIASVPGGYFSRNVAKAASIAGIRALFTSEPVKKTYYIDNCLVLGRYTLLRGMPPAVSAGLSSESLSQVQIKQYLIWQIKKIFKTIGGKYYIRFRRSYFEDRSRSKNQR
jgi:hypothetical protein